MVRDKILRALPGAALALLLGGLIGSCSYKLDRVDMRLSDQLTVDTKLVITKPIDENDSVEDLKKDNDELVAKIVQCTGAQGSWNEKGSDETHRSVYRFKLTAIPASEMNDFVECFQITNYEIQYEKREGVFRDRYYLRLNINVGVNDVDERDRWAELPAKIAIAMPGGDLTVLDKSVRKAVRLSIQNVSASEAIVSLKPVQARMDEALKLLAPCENRATQKDRHCLEDDDATWPNGIPVRLEFKSTKYRYGFDQIMAVLGLLFGSGLILGARSFLSRPRAINDHS